MSKIRSYKSVPVLLAMLFFVSTTGFSLDFHICKGEVYSFSFFGKADRCSMHKQFLSKKKKKGHSCCGKHKHAKQRNVNGLTKNCCSHGHISAVCSLDYNVANNSIQWENPLFLSPIPLAPFSERVAVVVDEVRMNDPPPIIGTDRTILYQVFRI